MPFFSFTTTTSHRSLLDQFNLNRKIRSRNRKMATPPVLSLALPSNTGRVLSIQSHTVQGYVGNKSAVFPLQLLGYDVDPINSVQFSNHTGYPTFKGQVLNGQQLWDLIEGLEANDLLFYTHVLTGYIGSVSFLDTVLEVINKLRSKNPNLTYVCDPVMGDEGKLYVPEELVHVYREKVVPLASMLTPNQFEAEKLTGLRINSEEDGREACAILHAAGPSKVVITSITIGGILLLIGSHQKEKGLKPEQFKIQIPKIPAYFTGTGDLMTALLLGWSNKYPEDVEVLKSYVSHWPAQRWQEYEPLLSYCRDNAVKLIACGTPLKVLRTVQAEGIRGLSESERKLYTPPAGSGFISGFTPFSRSSSLNMNSLTQIVPFGPNSYLSAQARVVEDHTMSQVILQAVADEGGTGLLLVVTGANHVEYGSRGTGLPARISRKIPKKSQVVVLLDPERQFLRKEGETPVADFLWYSAAIPCSRNCFDRAEIARVMNAAGRSRDALPQDIQKGLDLGLVSPEILQNFFDLEQYPLISELTQRFQGFRERLLADPKFLNRLAIEEAISITTTLVAQYEKRKENFFEELDYVITDSVRASVVDFFTVWLPAPTLSFISYADDTIGPNSINALKGLLGSIPDNAFQKSLAGQEWTLNLRIASVLVGGLKLAGVGVVSSFAAVGSSNALYAIRKFIKPELGVGEEAKRSPMLKTALVYGGYLGISSNIRYQVIAGLIEHRISDELSSQPLLVNMISFVVRVANSYFGTQQWIDLARSTGLQTQKNVTTSNQIPEALSQSTVEYSNTEEASIDDLKNQ